MSKEHESTPNKERRGEYLLVAILEIVIIGLVLGWIVKFILNERYEIATSTIYISSMMVWISVIGFTGLHRRFFTYVPENSGAVIVNQLRTYEEPKKEEDRTKLMPTKSLREVGPGLQGLLLWEKVGWVIDLGKQITIKKEVTAYSKDKIELKLDWQVILTALRGYLVNLVRHDGDTIALFFEGACQAKLIELISHEYAQDVPAEAGAEAIQSLSERLVIIKEEFNNFLGGPNDTDDIEKQFGTFTNSPQIINIRWPKGFTESAEALRVNMNNAAAMTALTRDNPGLKPNQALIAVLTAQGKSPDGLIDLNISGLENLHTLNMAGNPANFLKKTGNKKKGDGNE